MSDSSRKREALGAPSSSDLPEKVNVVDLQADQMLLTLSQSEKIKTLNLADNKFYSREDLRALISDPSLSYDVLKTGGNYFVIYDKNRLGKGSFGEVFAAQNINTGEWIAVKKFEVNEVSKVDNAFDEFYKKNLAMVREKKSQAESNNSQGVAEIEKQINMMTEPKNIEAFKKRFYNSQVAAFSGAQHETGMLTLNGDMRGSLVERWEDINKGDFLHFYLPMEYAGGKELTEALGITKDQPNLYDFEELCGMAKQFSEQLLAMEKLGIILRDLHTNNAIYNDKNKRLKLVDLGDALRADKKGIGLGTPVGSEPYLAPEIMEALQNQIKDPSLKFEYNEKTTVYAFGAILAKMFELADGKISPYVKDVNDNGRPISRFKTLSLRDKDTESSKIDNLEQRKEMLALLANMMHKNPSIRPNLAAACAQLEQVMQPVVDYSDIMLSSPDASAFSDSPVSNLATTSTSSVLSRLSEAVSARPYISRRGDLILEGGPQALKDQVQSLKQLHDLHQTPIAQAIQSKQIRAVKRYVLPQVEEPAHEQDNKQDQGIQHAVRNIGRVQ